jgi:hypothetical protein
MITRRSLLAAMLGACAAPAYVKAGILMPVRKVWTPQIITFDNAAPRVITLPAALNGWPGLMVHVKNTDPRVPLLVDDWTAPDRVVRRRLMPGESATVRNRARA